MTTLYAKGFLFDMDGTLVDSTAVGENIWINCCAQNGLNVQEMIARVMVARFQIRCAISLVKAKY
ncbi:hypothetical protein ABU178_19165 [Pantoea osteomyelitidis]|uniref:Phosphoglycolate phosphatase n=1 Tax=Pantoea osteomyelitidis TaxID=3230026 RepID=A0ABW7Q126_9GAMM